MGRYGFESDRASPEADGLYGGDQHSSGLSLPAFFTGANASILAFSPDAIC